MKTILTFLLLALSTSVLAKKFDPPKKSIEQAVEISKAYVKEHNIITDSYYVTEAVFKNTYNEYEPAFWEIKWQKTPEIKGAWFIIRIYNDGKIESRFGE